LGGKGRREATCGKAAAERKPRRRNTPKGNEGGGKTERKKMVLSK